MVRSKVKEFMPRTEILKKELQEQEKKRKSFVNTTESADPERQKIRSALEDSILKEKPKISWDDVAGLVTAKKALEEAVILPIKFPQMFTGKRKAWKGILLYGPPGTGKSLLAKATAGMTDSTFISVSSSDLVSKWFGQSEKSIKELFAMAQENKPAIIFIDEIDSICGKRTDNEDEPLRRIKTEFMVQMQKILDSDGVLVLGATNRPFDLDSAVRRRFEKRIYIPLPDKTARREIFKIHLGNEVGHINKDYMDYLVNATKGYSGSDISIVVRDVLMAPVREAMRATFWKQVLNPCQEKGPQFLWTPCSPNTTGAVPMSLMQLKPEEILLSDIREEHFMNAIKNNRPSVSTADLELQEKFTKMYGIPDILSREKEEESPETNNEKKEELELMQWTSDISKRIDNLKRERKDEKKRRKHVKNLQMA